MQYLNEGFTTFMLELELVSWMFLFYCRFLKRALRSSAQLSCNFVGTYNAT